MALRSRMNACTRSPSRLGRALCSPCRASLTPASQPTPTPQAIAIASTLPLRQRLSSAVLSTGLTAALLLCPVTNAYSADDQAAIPRFDSIADIGRDTVKDIDLDGDGIISRSEFESMGLKMAEAMGGAPAPTEEEISAAQRQYDLNQDGKVTTEELLACAVYEPLPTEEMEEVVNATLFKVFDRNTDDKIDEQEFKDALPSLGKNSDAVKQFVFQRADAFGDGNGSLDRDEFASATGMMRALFAGGF